eukprot:7196842-Pyramimonas_sp.AAC.1
MVPVGPEAAAHLVADAGSAHHRVAIGRRHACESRRAVAVEVAVRAAAAALLPLLLPHLLASARRAHWRARGRSHTL